MPLRLASDRGLSGHSFRTIRFLNSRHSGSDSLFEWTDVGWTWSGCPDPSRKAPGPGSGTRAVFADWRQEFELAIVRCDELAGFLEKSGLNPGRRPAAALFNLAHFVDSIRAATSRFDSSKRLEIESHRELPYRALAWKVCLSIGDCGARGQSQQVVEFDPAEQVAVPGNTGRQRLGLSARLH